MKAKRKKAGLLKWFDTYKLLFVTNIWYRDWTKRLLRKFVELKALVNGQAFRCEVLSGQSNYNLCINADLSVSCNCDDIRGDGRIGSLKFQTLEQVIRGPIAQEFRRKLAAGKIPIPKCVTCYEFKRLPKAEAKRWETDFKFPPQRIMFENNAGCNIACIGCGRTLRPLEKLKMSITNVERVIKEITAAGVKGLSYFSLGEPFLSKNIRDEFTLIRSIQPNIWIHTSTNGMLVDNDDKRQAALLTDIIHFSIDGCSQETANKYQVGIDFEKAYSNLCKLVELKRSTGNKRTLIIWRYVIFNWNDRREHLERTMELVAESGVDRIEFISTRNPYFGISWRFLFANYWKEVAPLKSLTWRIVNISEQAKQFELDEQAKRFPIHGEQSHHGAPTGKEKQIA